MSGNQAQCRWKKWIALCFTFGSLSATGARAVDTQGYACPAYLLKCKLYRVDSSSPSGERKVLEKSARYEAFNWSEPSDPPDTCAVSVRLTPEESGVDRVMVAYVSEYLDASLYVYKYGEYGVDGAQASVTVAPGNSFSLHYRTARLTCVMEPAG